MKTQISPIETCDRILEELDVLNQQHPLRRPYQSVNLHGDRTSSARCKPWKEGNSMRCPKSPVSLYFK
ncbi:hypothetical protein JTE90_029281 [Oedothorax gibbosus]|uniref:Uncharacterized protein n=1 Tax=Oedothorax gibbosus TaxID=931172 RepID=A0AAV6U5N0_9ARAC|nr:hypothetical protein JTE90_029281 [Oedothorax gibbosus]